MKKSFADCIRCPLYSKDMVVGETNCEQDLNKVDLLVIAEAPANEEVKLGRPLVGPAGKIFRLAFKLSRLETLNYYITNCCLCANIENGVNSNPPKEAVEICSPNLDKIIEATNPKVILALGDTVMKRFGIAKSGVTRFRGNFYKYNGYDVFLTFHPSYVARGGGKLTEGNGKILLDDFNLLYNKINPSFSFDDKEELEEISKEKIEMYSFRIPEKYYSEDYMLFDVQSISDLGNVVYIFKKKDGSKEYFKYPTSENYFYIIKGLDQSDASTVASINEVSLVKNESDAPINCCTFEKSLSLDKKHMVDYKYNLEKMEKEDPIFPLKIQFMDIEVYNKGSRAFPNPKISPNPINVICFKYSNQDVTNIFLLKRSEMDKSQIKDIENVKITVFESERELIKRYFEDTKNSNCDIITAWNGYAFDFPYIRKRAEKSGLNPNTWSPLGVYKYDEKWDSHHLYGFYLLDLMELYKKYTYFSEGKLESYKLDFVARKELGEGKIAYEGSLDSVYEKDINKFVLYSSTDVNLLQELESKLRYIDLTGEISKICSSPWSNNNSTVGIVDPLFIRYAKNKGLVCRDSLPDLVDERFEGAFVNDPISGLHSWVIDLDFTSLYPSIISTLNLDQDTFIALLEEDVAKRYIYNRESLKGERIKVTFDSWKNSSTSSDLSLEEFEEFVSKNQAIVSISGTVFLGHEIRKSFVSEICEIILDSRKKYKNLRNKCSSNKDLYQLYENRQLAYKILANSIYGVLGNKHFRMFNINLAKTITLTGQEVNRFSQYHVGYYLRDGLETVDKEFLNKIGKDNPPYIIYGDTDSIFLCIGNYLKDKSLIDSDSSQDKITKLVLDVSKECEDFLNKNVLVEFCKLHNVKPRFSKFFLKQEVVSKRALFFSKKKRYALHIVNREGMNKEEYDIKGMVLRRSDYPSYTKEKIQEILDMLLKFDKISFSDIWNYIVKTEIEIIRLCKGGSKCVAKPVTYKDDSEYKKVPSHSLGFKLWNSLEYEYFVPGTRGYLFKIKGLDSFRCPDRILDNTTKISEKNNSVVLPFEEERLPEYYVIDVDGMVDFAWKKRYAELLEPVMEDIRPYIGNYRIIKKDDLGEEKDEDM